MCGVRSAVLDAESLMGSLCTCYYVSGPALDDMSRVIRILCCRRSLLMMVGASVACVLLPAAEAAKCNTLFCVIF